MLITEAKPAAHTCLAISKQGTSHTQGCSGLSFPLTLLLWGEEELTALAHSVTGISRFLALVVANVNLDVTSSSN